eukprot:TRINITY_DN855_c0_g1_i1.p1 TRINITY_DN855_c0_g1~~TRINITY_DN855_c0_g1_i1.p1  ORF type:complete len:295 (+),score=69.03 TRINITY_DN855_c0_g1_i1:362-1246(+)
MSKRAGRPSQTMFVLTAEQKRKLQRLAPNARPAYLQALKKQAMQQQGAPAMGTADGSPPVSANETSSQQSSPRSSKSSSAKDPKKKKQSLFGGRKKKTDSPTNSGMEESETESEDETVPSFTLETVVRSTALSKMLLEYTQSLFCDENVRLFFHLLALERDLPEMSQAEFQAQSHSIVAKFLKVGAQHEVNVSDQMRLRIVEVVIDSNDLPIDWFKGLKAEIESLLKNDSFLKFAQSDYVLRNRKRVREILSHDLDNTELLAEYSCLEMSIVDGSSTAVDKTLDDNDDEAAEGE